MTAERREEMLMYKKQACIAEIRLKTKNREKEFLNRVQRSLEEIQVFFNAVPAWFTFGMCCNRPPTLLWFGYMLLFYPIIKSF